MSRDELFQHIRVPSRPDPTVEIAFIRRSLWSGSSRGSPNQQASTGVVTRPLGAAAAPQQTGVVNKPTPTEQPVGESLPTAVSASQVRGQSWSRTVESGLSPET